MSSPPLPKLHRNLAEAVINALYTIFAENRYADKVIENTLHSNPRWGARDRAFIAETTYDIVRWWRLLWFLTGIQPDADRLWQLFGVWLLKRGYSLPDWAEFDFLDASELPLRLAQAREIRAFRESIPDWIDQLGEEELGEAWNKILHRLNQPAPVVIRTNTLKITPDALMELLHEENIHTRRIGNVGLVLNERQNLFLTDLFKAGLFEIQDASSQEVAPALGVESGMRVIDACAGGGGKALHLAALMENKGRIIALDVESWKLKNLQIRARRAGATIIEPRVIENRKVIKRLHGSADRVLLDVPCSGLGVLRRNPDTKWKLSLDNLNHVKGLQQQILQNYSELCKIGGRIVYSTCSILPSENQAQIKYFLEKNIGKFQLLEEKIITPQAQFDGFYIAVLQRLA